MMKLLFESRKHATNADGDVYTVRLELVNAPAAPAEVSEHYFSQEFEIEVTREQWERFLPSSWIEFGDEVKT